MSSYIFIKIRLIAALIPLFVSSNVFASNQVTGDKMLIDVLIDFLEGSSFILGALILTVTMITAIGRQSPGTFILGLIASLTITYLPDMVSTTAETVSPPSDTVITTADQSLHETININTYISSEKVRVGPEQLDDEFDICGYMYRTYKQGNYTFRECRSLEYPLRLLGITSDAQSFPLDLYLERIYGKNISINSASMDEDKEYLKVNFDIPKMSLNSDTNLNSPIIWDEPESNSFPLFFFIVPFLLMGLWSACRPLWEEDQFNYSSASVVYEGMVEVDQARRTIVRGTELSSLDSLRRSEEEAAEVTPVVLPSQEKDDPADTDDRANKKIRRIVLD